MKFLKLLAMLFCIANLAAAQTLPPESLPVGNSAVIESLSKARTISVTAWAVSAESTVNQTFSGLQNVKSTDDVLALLKGLVIKIRLKDPLDTINVSASILDINAKTLFTAATQFRLVKSYDPVTKKAKYDSPYYAVNLYFILEDTQVYVADATSAYMLNRDGTKYYLDVANGSVWIPGWMNSYWGQYFTELVINDTIRYDMNTGTLLTLQIVTPQVKSVDFSNLSKVRPDTQNWVTLYTAPSQGYIPSFEVTATSTRFKLNVVNQGNDWIAPHAVQIATLDDIRAGRGYKIFNYYKGMEIEVVPGTYFMKVEYQSTDIGGDLQGPSTTPVTVGGNG